MRKNRITRYEVTLNPNDHVDMWIIQNLIQSRLRRPYSETLRMALADFFEAAVDKDKSELYKMIRRRDKENSNLIIMLKMTMTENETLKNQNAGLLAVNDQLRAFCEEYGIEYPYEDQP